MLYKIFGIALVLVTGCLLGQSQGKATLTKNGYDDFVVAISPDVPQDDTMIDSIKSMMRDMSRVLYTATRHRAHLRTVKILLPKTWNYKTDQTVSGESFQDAEFRIDIPNNAYGESPYTQQSTDCGVPGDFTHLTPSYVKDGLKYGDKGKTLLHEFAKLRWGVFEEHGYPGDDKFPLFYLKTVWTEAGQANTAEKNFCVNDDIVGYEQDIVTGGGCSHDASGVPDGNCMFFATQETKATSSIMSLPYISTNVNFCDDGGEEYLHDPDLPTKQNLFCNGQSTWSVISANDDFKNNNNPTNDTITNTDPRFIIIGGEEQVASFVMVMDVSRSMTPGFNDAKVDRLTAMKDAAKRWVKYDVPEGTKLGMLPFSTDTYMNKGFAMTDVTEAAKADMIDKIDKLSVVGGTCIATGLFQAVVRPELLNNQEGNAILLITDGKQEGKCDNTYNQAKNLLVRKKVRLITIALGDAADAEIEDIAEATDGKSYFVQDNSGPGDFNDAFTGSTTFQPADTISNTDMTIYQHTWDYNKTNPDFSVLDFFDVDASIGKNLTFRLEIQNGNSNCKSPINITLIDPDVTGRYDYQFSCSKTNYGTYIQKFTDLAKEGRWQFMIKSKELFESITVHVTSRSRADNDEPIRTQCSIKTGQQALGEDVFLKLSAVADVKKGNTPVIGAKVMAYITRPNDNGELPPLELELLDNGSGADVIKNDGIYSRYFTKYTGTGRYSVKCQVVGDQDTQVNDGFIVSKDFEDTYAKAVPAQPGAPICCGSNALSPNSKLSNTGNFTRQSAGGSFQAKEGDLPKGDKFPPSRVTDLEVKNMCSEPTLSFVSPGDDFDSEDLVKSYTIKYSKYAGNLTEETFDDKTVEELLDDDLVGNVTLSPVKGGSTFSVHLNSTMFETGMVYFFRMKATDEAKNVSPLSNLASARCMPSAAGMVVFSPISLMLVLIYNLLSA